ncbi:SLAP domain-containing protein [Lactobacillus amylovorus]|uniref:SLAP domain-containing protein n=1 Tax=Lactobacillus amylovorus TaxID=1604 RepID=UPI002331538E|nr:SLAP domain-containing protein [Lactobacillus amylovorus]
MKKSKMISLTAAALLTVAPVIAPTIVHAADTPNTGTNTSTNASNLTNEVTSSTTTANNTTGQATPISASPLSVEFTQDGQKQSLNPNGMYFQVSKDSNFNPLDFTGSNGSQFKIVAAKDQKITVDSNTVDTSKAGSVGEVKLTVGSTSVTFHVLVKPEGEISLNLAPRDWVYGDGDGVIFRQGEKWYISNDTKVINGEMYTGMTKPQYRGTYWIKTEYLSNTNPAPTLVKKTVMHKALAYSKGGGSKYRYYKAFQEIYVNSEPVSFNGGQYYQVFNADGTYTSDYLKVTNIDGTKRTLKKNAYVYATSTRRADRTLLRKGTTITTYGGSYKFKNGKRYYRIEGATATNKRYVKVVNFE